MSAFYIWNPFVAPDSPKRLEFVLTNGDVGGRIPQDRGFIESILKEIGTEVKPANWSIEPYRSKYYSEYIDEDDWRDTWQVIWKVSVLTTNEISNLLKMNFPWIGTNVIGEDWQYAPDDDAIIGCLIVSDFDSDEALNNAQAAITDDDVLNEMRQQHSFSIPIFSQSELLNKYKQLHIDVGQFPGEFFAQGADYAERVLELCGQAGGTVHFEARD